MTRPIASGTVTAEILSSAACWQLLRSTDLGRLAVIAEGRPDIFPVNYAVDHGCVVLRTAGGTKIDAALAGGSVAFEVDGQDATSRQAWSVVVKGPAEELVHLDELLAADDLPLRPLHGSAKHRFLRVVAEEVTGRRFTPAEPGIWQGPLTGKRSAPPE